MPSTLTPAAKAKVAAATAVVMAGVTAWQIATRDGFTWWDLIPVVASVAAAACTDQVDNTLASPTAKATVHGALSAVAAVAAALATVVGPEPSGVSLAKLLVAGLGTLAVWYMPELGPEVKTIEGEVADGTPAAQVVARVVGDVSRFMGPDLPTTVAPAPAPVVATSDPLPIHDAAPKVSAALVDTAPLPTVNA